MKREPVRLSPKSFPEPIRNWTEGAAIYDSSCSPEARVFFLEKDAGYYLKTAAAGTLKAEAEMTGFFHKRGLSAEVLYYGTDGGKDYMVTSRIQGEDCTFPDYLNEPERLCDTIAELLRALHGTDPSGCPGQDRLQRYIASVDRGRERQFYEPELFRGMWEFSSFEEAWAAASEGIRELRQDAVIHGDYCLPNILMNHWRFSGFIDLGNAGFCDRHIDIFWGIWSLNYNLKTTRLTDRFIDAYGRESVDRERLGRIAAMEMIGC